MSRTKYKNSKGLLLNNVKHWECPECHKQAVTNEARPHTEFHSCPSLRGAWAPLIEAGIKAHLVVNERDDYIGTAIPFVDQDGKVIKSITTIREDGEDCHILAPTVNFTIRGE